MKQQHLRWLIPAATTVSLTAACGPGETTGTLNPGTGSTSGTGASATGATSTGGGNTGGGNTGGTAATGGTSGTGGFATGGVVGTGGGGTVDPGVVQAAALQCAAEWDCGTPVTEDYLSEADCVATGVAELGLLPYASDPACGAAMLAMAQCYDAASTCQTEYDYYGVPYNEVYTPYDVCYTESELAYGSCT